MYSELDVHMETFRDPIYKFLWEGGIDHTAAEHVTIDDPEDAEHPTTVIEITQHDGRKFRTTITTEEVDA